jgi:hypothetical protein
MTSIAAGAQVVPPIRFVGRAGGACIGSLSMNLGNDRRNGCRAR